MEKIEIEQEFSEIEKLYLSEVRSKHCVCGCKLRRKALHYASKLDNKTSQDLLTNADKILRWLKCSDVN